MSNDQSAGRDLQDEYAEQEAEEWLDSLGEGARREMLED